MLREKIRSWLGLDELEEKINLLEEELVSTMETINMVKKELEESIGRLESEKVAKSSFEEVIARLEGLEKRLDMIVKVSASQQKVKELSNAEEIEKAILEVLSAGNKVTVSELKSLLGISTRQLYKVLSGLEKSKKVKKEREGKKVFIKLLQ